MKTIIIIIIIVVVVVVVQMIKCPMIEFDALTDTSFMINNDLKALQGSHKEDQHR